MPTIDEFESVFRAAVYDRYEHRPATIERVLALSDLPLGAAQAWSRQVQAFVAGWGTRGELSWSVQDGAACDTVGEVLALVAEQAPQLVVTYRNLHSTAREWPYSLSDHVEVLTQISKAPVLLLPRPDAEGRWRNPRTACRHVVALTDHLAGDHRLVRWAAATTAPGGTLWLTHVEDDAVFDRYLDAISKIPELDTEVARRRIAEVLLSEPQRWIDSIAEALRHVDLTVERRVTFGHTLRSVRALLEEHPVDLLVLNTKDEDQQAMHGLAYPLAVELRDVPVLLL